jgi:hypothetical protein
MVCQPGQSANFRFSTNRTYGTAAGAQKTGGQAKGCTVKAVSVQSIGSAQNFVSLFFNFLYEQFCHHKRENSAERII